MSAPAFERGALGHSALTGVVFVGTHPERYLVAVRSLLERTDIDIVVGCLYAQFLSTFSRLGPRVTRSAGRCATTGWRWPSPS